MSINSGRYYIFCAEALPLQWKKNSKSYRGKMWQRVTVERTRQVVGKFERVKQLALYGIWANFLLTYLLGKWLLSNTMIHSPNNFKNIDDVCGQYLLLLCLQINILQSTLSKIKCHNFEVLFYICLYLCLCIWLLFSIISRVVVFLEFGNSTSHLKDW